MSDQSLYQPRKVPRQARSKACVSAILDAAARILTEEGYAAATTNQIAEVAGVSIGSLYEYFPGKEAIFAALRARLTNDSYTVMLDHIGDITPVAGVDGKGAAPTAVIERVVEGRIKAILLDPVLHCKLSDEVPRYVTQEQSDTLLDEFFAIAMDFLKHHAKPEDGRQPEIVAEMAMRTMYSVVESLVVDDPDKLENPAYTNELKHMMCRYILDYDTPRTDPA